jgi:serine/threonine protein kinase, bacterial
MSELLQNRYRIIRELAEGGFGKTFIAEDTQMPSHRRCVIKELKPLNEGSQIYELIKDRFQREAVILEDLGNNNNQIPSLFAHFSSEGKFYLVQEYIEGETLASRVQKAGKLSESAVKEILVKLLIVLDFVHSKRIIHRDIKPENIILRNNDDTPVLIDFGAVREIMGTVLAPSGNSTSSIVIGTPGYMPAEQLAGRPMFASDLYALALTMIYALTSKIPSEFDTDPQTGNIMWLQDCFVSPTMANVLDRAHREADPCGIAFNPQDRWQSARTMLQALQEEAQQHASTIMVETPRIPQPTVVSPSPTAGCFHSPNLGSL